MPAAQGGAKGRRLDHETSIVAVLCRWKEPEQLLLHRFVIGPRCIAVKVHSVRIAAVIEAVQQHSFAHEKGVHDRDIQTVRGAPRLLTFPVDQARRDGVKSVLEVHRRSPLCSPARSPTRSPSCASRITRLRVSCFPQPLLCPGRVTNKLVPALRRAEVVPHRGHQMRTLEAFRFAGGKRFALRHNHTGVALRRAKVKLDPLQVELRDGFNAIGALLEGAIDATEGVKERRRGRTLQ